jgi:hypothetical protein
MPTEDEKALEHLAQEERREAFQRFLQSKLTAPTAPLQALKEKYRPVLRTGKYPNEGGR